MAYFVILRYTAHEFTYFGMSKPPYSGQGNRAVEFAVLNPQ